MYRIHSKRRELLTRIAVYSVMTLAVIGLVSVSLFYVLGYRFNFSQQRVEQSGLVQFLTIPSSATIEIDGVRHAQTTPAKEFVVPGSHEFVMWREGYETWRKTIEIHPGTLTWLNYARLIPKERPIESIDQLASVSGASASPHRKYMAIVPDEKKPNIRLYTLTSVTVPSARTIMLDAQLYAEATVSDVAHTFTLEGWDDSDRYLMIRHTYGKDSSIEWLVLDRVSGEVVNVTRLFDVDLQKLAFIDTSGARFYGQSDGDVRVIDVAAGTLSRPIVSGVDDFWLHFETGTISYIETPDASGHRAIGVVKRGHKPVTIHRTGDDTASPVLIQASRYFGDDYVAIVLGKTVTVYKGAFPEDENDSMKQASTFTVEKAVTHMAFSPTGRFILVQQGDSFVSYDNERGSLSTAAKIAGSGSVTPLRWLDDYMVWSDRSGALVTREFDGANEHTLHTLATGFDVTLSVNGTYLYSIGKTESGYQLQRIRMILN